MRTAADLFKEIYYWNHIGTGDDIVRCPDHRPEYQHLVSKYRKAEVSIDEIPFLVMNYLSLEMLKPSIFQSIFWRLLWMDLKKKVRG